MKHIKTYKDIHGDKNSVMSVSDVVGMVAMMLGLGIMFILMLLV